MFEDKYEVKHRYKGQEKWRSATYEEFNSLAEAMKFVEETGHSWKDDEEVVIVQVRREAAMAVTAKVALNKRYL